MLDDLVDPEIVVAVAATSAVFSSRARHWLQRGAVYGVAGALIAGDALATLGRGMARGVRERMAELPQGNDGRATPTRDNVTTPPVADPGAAPSTSTQDIQPAG